MKRTYLLPLSAVFLISCSGTKKMTKKAVALEQQGMYSEASADYLLALERKGTNLVWPKISITSEELNLGQECGQSILLNESINYFQDKGFEIVDDSNADYQISIKSNTFKGLTNNRMHSALLQYEFVVKDSSSNIVFQEQKRELKGVQSNFPSAGINAYERSLDDFKWGILSPFIKQLVGE